MALEGRLIDMSLEDLFMIFRTGRKSGVLLLSERSERGVIYVFQGRLRDAVLVYGSAQQIAMVGERAVVQMLLWKDAEFCFRHDLHVLERPVRIQRNSVELVAYAAELLRRRTVPGAAFTPDTRFELMTTAAVRSNKDVFLDLAKWRILSMISSNFSFLELCTLSNLPPKQVEHILQDLIAQRLVRVALAHKAHTAARHMSDRLPTTPALRSPAPSPTYHTLPNRDATRLPSRPLIAAIMRRVRSL
jgi:hypothetical protein